MPLKSDAPAEAPGRQAARSGYIPALDGVRGIAICAVLFVHSYTFITSTLPRAAADTIARVAEVGAFGVDLFFVLSGFLITGILVDTRDSPHYFSNFYARRFLRLFPLYYAYLAFAALVLPHLHTLLHTSIPDYHGNWMWYILYVCNWKPGNAQGDPALGHFWSLAVEEQFYLLWPAMVWMVPRRVFAWLCVAVAIGSLALRIYWSSHDVSWDVLYRVTVTRLDTLALGALAALAVRSPRWRAWCEQNAGRMAAIGLVVFAAIGVMAGSFSWEEKAIQTMGASIAAVAFAGLVLYAALRRAGTIHDWLVNPLLRAYGKYSYGMYVYHMIILVHCGWLGGWVSARAPNMLAIPISITVVVLGNVLVFYVSSFSYQRFEKPILSYKDRFRD